MINASEILSTPEQPELALAKEGSGLSPGIIDWKNSIPSWLHFADQELAMREAQYAKHVKDIQDAKDAVGKDYVFDNSKVRSGDVKGFVDRQNGIIADAYKNAIDIYQNPTSPEALKLNQDKAQLLAEMNQSAQANAARQKVLDQSLTAPDTYDKTTLQSEIQKWDAMPAPQAAGYLPDFNKKVFLNFIDMAGDLRTKLGLNKTETFTGRNLGNGYFQTSEKQEIPPEKVQAGIDAEYAANKQMNDLQYSNLIKNNPDQLVNDAIVVHDLKDANGKRLDITTMSPQDKANIIQQYQATPKDYFQNSLSPLLGATTVIGSKATVFSPFDKAGANKPTPPQYEPNAVVSSVIYSGGKQIPSTQFQTAGGWDLSGTGSAPSNINVKAPENAITASTGAYEADANGKRQTYTGLWNVDLKGVYDFYKNPSDDKFYSSQGLTDQQKSTWQKERRAVVNYTPDTQFGKSVSDTYYIPYTIDIRQSLLNSNRPAPTLTGNELTMPNEKTKEQPTTPQTNNQPKQQPKNVGVITPQIADDIMQANKNLNFVQRYINADTSPKITNPDGSVSTHLMAYENMDDGTPIVFPTIIQGTDGKLKKLGHEEAKQYAIKNKQYIAFPNTPAGNQQAADFAANGYKLAKQNSTQSNQQQGTQQFVVNGVTYNIPNDKVAAFKKAKGIQ